MLRLGQSMCRFTAWGRSGRIVAAGDEEDSATAFVHGRCVAQVRGGAAVADLHHQAGIAQKAQVDRGRPCGDTVTRKRAGAGDQSSDVIDRTVG